MRFQDLLDKGIEFPSEDPPLTPQDIADLESLIQAPLPEDYRDYLLHANGGEIDLHFTKLNIYGYYTTAHWPKDNGIFEEEEVAHVQYFFALEKVVRYYKNWKDKLPADTLVIGTDPGGDFYLMGIGPQNRGKIYIWCFVMANRMEEPDLMARAYLGFIADNFVELVLSLKKIPEAK